MITENTPKNSPKFLCKYCDFKCFNQNDYNRHLLTDKHKRLQNNDVGASQNKKYICECGKEYKYRQGELKLDKGDIVVYYTDGITEAENPNKELFGFERLKEVVYNNKENDVDIIKKNILNEIDIFCKGYQQVDDITFVVIKNTEEDKGEIDEK